MIIAYICYRLKVLKDLVQPWISIRYWIFKNFVGEGGFFFAAAKSETKFCKYYWFHDYLIIYV